MSLINQQGIQRAQCSSRKKSLCFLKMVPQKRQFMGVSSPVRYWSFHISGPSKQFPMQLIGPDGLRKVLHVTAGELSLVQQSQPGALGFWFMVDGLLHWFYWWFQWSRVIYNIMIIMWYLLVELWILNLLWWRIFSNIEHAWMLAILVKISPLI